MKEYGFGWFLLPDGRIAPVFGPSYEDNLASHYMKPHSKERLNQLGRFEASFVRLIEEIDIVSTSNPHSHHGYRFGGLTGSSGSTPPTCQLAFHEQSRTLIHAINLGQLRCVPVETFLAELVADAVLRSATQYWAGIASQGVI